MSRGTRILCHSWRVLYHCTIDIFCILAQLGGPSPCNRRAAILERSKSFCFTCTPRKLQPPSTRTLRNLQIYKSHTLKIATFHSRLNGTPEQVHGSQSTPFARQETQKHKTKQPQALRPPVPPKHQPALSVVKPPQMTREIQVR